MPPKTNPKGGKASPSKKKKGIEGKAKKKEWLKARVRSKLNNTVLFDQVTYGKLHKELVTPSVISERLKVRASPAKTGLRELQTKGLVKCQIVCTRAAKEADVIVE
ncbi:unnamed protein product [Heligmosomoides polygyrus]|uniref:40S ribosomal protein S25 n=1 Tax=Heligmosomoides polygyrus TaxID=6339 RepID=A0A183FJ08_HELPZ|nr:unnamed protein product [Heligmosomoides polygyrus]